MKLNNALNNYDWQMPVDSSGASIDTLNWPKTLYQENSAWKVRFTSQPIGTSSSGFLSFPLSATQYPQGAYTSAKVISVLDHHMSSVYSDHDGQILTFTGEVFRANAQHPAASRACYPKESGGAWSALLRNLYRGTNDDGCGPDVAINYEAHPGYDYVAAIGTTVYASAGGRVVSANDGCIPKGISAGCAAWGALGIDHGNGYISQYLHLSRRDVAPGAVVTEGQMIGLTGNTAPPSTSLVGPHLHFELLRLRSGLSNDYQIGSYATVDPYGFDTSKGIQDFLTTFNGNTANVCLWKTGCTY